jgi:4-hydroxybenzoate polyprenyltransferase
VTSKPRARFGPSGEGSRLVRAGDWWDDKIPPLIAIAVLSNLAHGRSTGTGLRDLGLFLVTAIGAAAFGHVVNDLSDIGADRLAGKQNLVGSLSTLTRVGLLAGCLAAALAPWIWLPHLWLAGAFLAAELVLLVAYSVPPVRLKERGVMGVVTDAGYALILPALIALVLFGPATGHLAVTPFVLVAVVASLAGVRGIVWHQISDLANDRVSGVDTLVMRTGEGPVLRLMDQLAAVEVGALAVLLVVVCRAVHSPVLGAVCLAYVPWRIFQVRFLGATPGSASRRGPTGGLSDFLGYWVSVGIVQRFLPVASLVVLSIREPWWWLVTIAYVALFQTVFSDVREVGWAGMCDGAAHLAAEPGVLWGARRVRRERAALVAHSRRSDASHLSDLPARWIFVFCGSAEHAGAMRTAVRYLRAVSNRDIWVITDSSRNEGELDTTGVAEVLDVAAPTSFDDHQAAIWLKTRAHRIVPAGRWCYLDTDIIAIAPAMDEVFDHLSGPIGFTSDLPAAGNSIDHFSPYAMTCGCHEKGLLQCIHLRAELEGRFGIEVPEGWSHWNGGVFVFESGSNELLDRWHEIAVASFEWPEWRTRDQGALIASAWLTGAQDLPRVAQEFNFIVADPLSKDVCLDPRRGWSLGSAGPWLRPHALHVMQPGLDAPKWDLGRETEVVVLRRMRHGDYAARFAAWRFRSTAGLRGNFWRIRDRVREGVRAAYWKVRIPTVNAFRVVYWAVRSRLELAALRMKRRKQRLRMDRIQASARRRLRRGGSHH